MHVYLSECYGKVEAQNGIIIIFLFLSKHSMKGNYNVYFCCPTDKSSIFFCPQNQLF